MLDVRPIYVSSCEFEIRLDRLPRVAWVPDNESSNDVHVMAMQIIDRLQGRVAGSLAVLAFLIFAQRRLREP